MIDALIAGNLCGKPVKRPGKDGRYFVTARVRASVRGGESEFVSVIAFADTPILALMELEDGDAVAIASELRSKPYTAKDGSLRAGLDVTVHKVLTEYAIERKRAIAGGKKDNSTPTAQLPLVGAEPAAEPVAEAAAVEFNDKIPF